MERRVQTDLPQKNVSGNRRMSHFCPLTYRGRRDYALVNRRPNETT